ncbi:ZIP Zinc transporter [Tolypocladium paradoxum]|uniref:ZIP Zinc transporter n=1 Tax=Tolypocladium paradoxum TaxID=94208 RepID=A0A2S4LAL7_9HYPO|nr:ZIP Zinc transporter [Tolypocladium paradoxum]
MNAAGNVKPQCGGGKEVGGEYDLGLHVAGLFLVLAASCLEQMLRHDTGLTVGLGCGFPVVAKKIKWLKISPKVFFVCKHFGTGVLIATAFVHVSHVPTLHHRSVVSLLSPWKLLPTAFASLSDPCLPNLFTEDYPPLPGVIMMVSLFVLFVIEMWLNGKTGGHSHGGPTGHIREPSPPLTMSQLRQQQPKPGPQVTNYGYPAENDMRSVQSIYEKRESRSVYDDGESTMPAWFVVFYEQYVRQHTQIVDMMHAKGIWGNVQEKNSHIVSIAEPHLDEENQVVDPAIYRKMSTNITLLEGGILFHSVFVGMTVSITIDGFIVLLVAILFHQMFEGLGLGSRIAAVPYPKGSIRPWVLVIAFGATAPIGQAIGLIARNSYDPQSAFGLIIVGVFNAISSGLLIYAALVDLLAEDFLSEEANQQMSGKDKAHAFGWVLAGALGMSVVGAFA